MGCSVFRSGFFQLFLAALTVSFYNTCFLHHSDGLAWTFPFGVPVFLGQILAMVSFQLACVIALEKGRIPVVIGASQQEAYLCVS